MILDQSLQGGDAGTGRALRRLTLSVAMSSMGSLHRNTSLDIETSWVTIKQFLCTAQKFLKFRIFSAAAAFAKGATARERRPVTRSPFTVFECFGLDITCPENIKFRRSSGRDINGQLCVPYAQAVIALSVGRDWPDVMAADDVLARDAGTGTDRIGSLQLHRCRCHRAHRSQPTARTYRTARTPRFPRTRQTTHNPWAASPRFPHAPRPGPGCRPGC